MEACGSVRVKRRLNHGNPKNRFRTDVGSPEDHAVRPYGIINNMKSCKRSYKKVLGTRKGLKVPAIKHPHRHAAGRNGTRGEVRDRNPRAKKSPTQP